MPLFLKLLSPFVRIQAQIHILYITNYRTFYSMFWCLHASVYMCVFHENNGAIASCSDWSVNFFGHRHIHIPYKCNNWPHLQSGTWFSVHVVFLHIHAPLHDLEYLHRKQCPWHGFKSRKHLLVQLRSMHCTQQEDNSLNVRVYNMHTSSRSRRVGVQPPAHEPPSEKK